VPRISVHPVPEPDDPLAQLQEGPIFIVGLARSGTTWLNAIYSAHPLVASVFESELFASDRGLLQLLSGGYFDRKDGLSKFIDRAELAREIRLLASRVYARRVWRKHRFLVEKTPGHLWCMPLIAEVFPDARFVHVLRDGRDVYVSTRAAARSWAPGWKSRRNSLAGVARHWKRGLRQIAADRAVLGDRLLELRYEEIKADPMGSIRRMFDFCNIPYDDQLVQEVFAKTDFATTHKADESAFFRGGRVGDWRTHMNVFEGLAFNAYAGRQLIEVGYEPNRRWFAPLRRKVRPPSRKRSGPPQPKPDGGVDPVEKPGAEAATR
jgi:Sulfotransferase family